MACPQPARLRARVIFRAGEARRRIGHHALSKRTVGNLVYHAYHRRPVLSSALVRRSPSTHGLDAYRRLRNGWRTRRAKFRVFKPCRSLEYQKAPHEGPSTPIKASRLSQTPTRFVSSAICLSSDEILEGNVGSEAWTTRGQGTCTGSIQPFRRTLVTDKALLYTNLGSSFADLALGLYLNLHPANHIPHLSSLGLRGECYTLLRISTPVANPINARANPPRSDRLCTSAFN